MSACCCCCLAWAWSASTLSGATRRAGGLPPPAPMARHRAAKHRAGVLTRRRQGGCGLYLRACLRDSGGGGDSGAASQRQSAQRQARSSVGGAELFSRYKRIVAEFGDRPQRLRQELRNYSRTIPLRVDRDWPLEVLHEDTALLVVNKPAGVKMHPSHRFEGGSMLNRVFGHVLPPHVHELAHDVEPPARIVHRLDEDTSGVLLLVKNRALLDLFLGAFRSNRITKSYLALVSAAVGSDGERRLRSSTWHHVNEPIGRARDHPMKRVADAALLDAKEAVTSFRALRTVALDGGDGGGGSGEKSDCSANRIAALVEARPRQGRTHQIRVHLAHAGLPIINDPLYQSAETRLTRCSHQLVDNGKIRLHAQRLTLPEELHQINSAWCQFSASPPEPFEQHAAFLGLDCALAQQVL